MVGRFIFEGVRACKGLGFEVGYPRRMDAPPSQVESLPPKFPSLFPATNPKIFQTRARL